MYVSARFADECEVYSYRRYITESIYERARGNALNKKWEDIARPVEIDPVDPEKVVRDVAERGGLVIG